MAKTVNPFSFSNGFIHGGKMIESVEGKLKSLSGKIGWFLVGVMISLVLFFAVTGATLIAISSQINQIRTAISLKKDLGFDEPEPDLNAYPQSLLTIEELIASYPDALAHKSAWDEITSSGLNKIYTWVLRVDGVRIGKYHCSALEQPAGSKGAYEVLASLPNGVQVDQFMVGKTVKVRGRLGCVTVLRDMIMYDCEIEVVE